jgi:hypothetical protein
LDPFKELDPDLNGQEELLHSKFLKASPISAGERSGDIELYTRKADDDLKLTGSNSNAESKNQSHRQAIAVAQALVNKYRQQLNDYRSKKEAGRENLQQEGRGDQDLEKYERHLNDDQ